LPGLVLPCRGLATKEDALPCPLLLLPCTCWNISARVQSPTTNTAPESTPWEVSTSLKLACEVVLLLGVKSSSDKARVRITSEPNMAVPCRKSGKSSVQESTTGVVKLLTDPVAVGSAAVNETYALFNSISSPKNCR
jgi:hypothetical protein